MWKRKRRPALRELYALTSQLLWRANVNRAASVFYILTAVFSFYCSERERRGKRNNVNEDETRFSSLLRVIIGGSPSSLERVASGGGSLAATTTTGRGVRRTTAFVFIGTINARQYAPVFVCRPVGWETKRSGSSYFQSQIGAGEEKGGDWFSLSLSLSEIAHAIFGLKAFLKIYFLSQGVAVFRRLFININRTNVLLSCD